MSSKPSYSASEVGLGNVANERQYSAKNPPPYPVKSVNGQTGEVTVTKYSFNGGVTAGRISLTIPNNGLAIVTIFRGTGNEEVLFLSTNFSRTCIGIKSSFTGGGVSLTSYSITSDYVGYGYMVTINGLGSVALNYLCNIIYPGK